MSPGNKEVPPDKIIFCINSFFIDSSHKDNDSYTWFITPIRKEEKKIKAEGKMYEKTEETTLKKK